MEESVTKEFKQFAMVTDYSDHHYSTRSISSTGNNRSFTSTNSIACKKIMQERSILENNLPETISVRGYEGRIDLLRAVIVGANGTPYHDNIVFFDIAFPIDYPNQPLVVYYHSGGLRLKPNLYQNGYVCLSLLNTWGGSGNERWVPSHSSILQALVSLQGLVLNEKPYYNEPGTKPSDDCKDCNNGVFILSCKTMLFSFQNPPKNFEGFVSLFFRERATTILKACNGYMNGEASLSYNSTTASTNSKFKKDLNTIYKKLEEAFTKNGMSQPKESDVVKEDEVVELKSAKIKRKRKTLKNEIEHDHFTRSKASKVTTA
ncbi:hypothetical protein JCGZ_19018 [Jatropha curcas]|uniref:UBC core domain-containing protein n=1 Tax=Jatropha curcas TaxID=180498 RepID=A0A067JYR0_JATCU|nr:probable ubiquitin-conjugating enzyme E2 26 [Jatropha curcas]KDP27938.1 hypothetical protein JCGZ_19018 [Jatropha curcas]